MILRQFTASFKNAFSSLFYRKQKSAKVLQCQEDINVEVIIALSSTKLCLSLLNFYSWAEIFGEMYIMFVKSISFPHEIW